jgi:RecA-family ATPase
MIESPEENGIAEIQKMAGTIKPKVSLESFRVNHADTISMSWQQIDALRPPYVIDNFVRQGELLLIAAESKSRKSWLVQDAGFAVASGEPWLANDEGESGHATRQATVHVFDLELDQAEMRFRFAKARSNRFTSTDEQRDITERFNHYSFDGHQPLEILAALDELKQAAQPGDLVIVDCFYQLEADGNETALVAATMKTLKRFAKDTKAAVLLVDHFRKAGDDKARNRIAGSFVKSASPSSIVAIEVDRDGVLKMHLDTRTFHGTKFVQCRFDEEEYRFVQVQENYCTTEAANERAKWLVELWKNHDTALTVTVKAAEAKWGMTRAGADKRLKLFEKQLWLTEKSAGAGKATLWALTGLGLDTIQRATSSVAPVAPSLF